MKTVATLFCGGGGSTLGAMAAGYTPVLSVEYDPAIASVYADNFGADHLIVADVRNVDYTPFARVDLLTASPPCTRASLANANAGESDMDISCAEAVARAIEEMRPRLFILENVAGYKAFRAYALIIDALNRLGYAWDVRVLNAADFGVPQSRKRLIVRAVLGGDGFLEHYPRPMRQVGWYEAIADLLPDCPESKLADWQVRRLPANFAEPSATLLKKKPDLKAILIENQNTTREPTLRVDSEPAATVTSANAGRRPASMPTALLFSYLARVAGEGSDVMVGESKPSPTIASAHGAAKYRALLVEGDAAGERARRALPAHEPAFTLKTASGGRVHRVLLLSDQPGAAGTGVSTSSVQDPAQTVAADSGGKYARALIDDGAVRCVRLTARCLARLQSFPDTYRLPEKSSLVATVIGNAVPPLLMRAIIESVAKNV